jgi:hypothetical protein
MEDALSSILNLHRSRIHEIAEIENVLHDYKHSTVKAFFTSKVDTFRAPYDRRPTDYPRSVVMGGTTNPEELLTDPEGNRRYWIIKIKDKIHLEHLKNLRDQLWAEAVELYRAGVRPYLSDDMEAQRKIANVTFQVPDEIQEMYANAEYAIALRMKDSLDLGLSAMDVIMAIQGIYGDLKIPTISAKRLAPVLRNAGWVSRVKKVSGASINRWFWPAPNPLDSLKC